MTSCMIYKSDFAGSVLNACSVIDFFKLTLRLHTRRGFA